MKEKIYAIPINDALNEENFCPFCYLYKQLEEDAVTYTLGPAMMEPDFRIITNKTGFCQKHIKQLNAQSKALPLSLLLQTHIETIQKLLDEDLKSQKKSILKKGNKKIDEVVFGLEKIKDSCAVCDRIENTFTRYFDTFIYMLKHENDFLEKVLKTDGFCMEHFTMLINKAKEKLSENEFKKLFIPVIDLQKKKISVWYENIKSFEKSHDYRNAGKPVNFPKDTILKASYLLNGEFKPLEKKIEKI